VDVVLSIILVRDGLVDDNTLQAGRFWSVFTDGRVIIGVTFETNWVALCLTVSSKSSQSRSIFPQKVLTVLARPARLGIDRFCGGCCRRCGGGGGGECCVCH
jgi:hypothetical protein